MGHFIGMLTLLLLVFFLKQYFESLHPACLQFVRIVVTIATCVHGAIYEWRHCTQMLKAHLSEIYETIYSLHKQLFSPSYFSCSV